jgi:hypothetical protein
MKLKALLMICLLGFWNGVVYGSGEADRAAPAVAAKETTDCADPTSYINDKYKDLEEEVQKIYSFGDEPAAYLENKLNSRFERIKLLIFRECSFSGSFDSSDYLLAGYNKKADLFGQINSKKEKARSTEKKNKGDHPSAKECEEITEQYVICNGSKYILDLKNIDSLKRDGKKLEEYIDSDIKNSGSKGLSK